MDFHERYVEMIRRHLGRDPKKADGLPDSALTKCERRLGVKLPAAMRDYYRLAGKLEQINKAHNFLFTPDELRIDDGRLWFMEENQAVVHWGIPLKNLSEDDPRVYQRANVDGAKWYSEKMTFSAFLISVFDWQAGFADPPS